MENLINKIHHSDCIDFMNTLPDNCIDLVLTDPPFGIDFNLKENMYKRKKDKIVDYIEVDEKDYPEFSRNWIKGAARILKSTGTLYIFSCYNHLDHILTAAREAGLSYIRQNIWQYSGGTWTSKKTVVQHYNMLHFCKDPDERTYNTYCRTNSSKESYHDRNSVWFYKREQWRNCWRSKTKLPREVVSKAIDYHSNVGDIIFDPFSGSGQISYVAKEMNRKFIGCELAEQAHRLGTQRIETNTYFLKDLK